MPKEEGVNWSKDFREIIMTPEETLGYPKETLVPNPLDESIPKEQKVMIDQQYAFTGGLQARVRFLGAAKYVNEEKDRMAFSVIAQQFDHVKSTPNMNVFKTEFFVGPIYAKGDDLQQCIDEMVSCIQDYMIEEVQRRIVEQINRARIEGRRFANNPDMPWFVYDPSDKKIFSSVRDSVSKRKH